MRTLTFTTDNPNLPVIRAQFYPPTEAQLAAWRRNDDQAGLTEEAKKLSNAKRVRQVPIFVGHRGVSFGAYDPYIGRPDEGEPVDLGRIVNALTPTKLSKARFPMRTMTNHGGARGWQFDRNVFFDVGMARGQRLSSRSEMLTPDWGRSAQAWAVDLVNRLFGVAVTTADVAIDGNSPRNFALNDRLGVCKLSVPYYALIGSEPDCVWAHVTLPAASFPGLRHIVLCTSYPYPDPNAVGLGEEELRKWDLWPIGLCGEPWAVDALLRELPSWIVRERGTALKDWGSSTCVYAYTDSSLVLAQPARNLPGFMPYSPWVVWRMAYVYGLPEWSRAVHFYCPTDAQTAFGGRSDAPQDMDAGAMHLAARTYRVDWHSGYLAAALAANKADHSEEAAALARGFAIRSYVPAAPIRVPQHLIADLEVYKRGQAAGQAVQDQVFLRRDEQDVTLLQLEAEAVRMQPLPLVHHFFKPVVTVGTGVLFIQKKGNQYLVGEGGPPLSEAEAKAASLAGTVVLDETGNPVQFNYTDAELQIATPDLEALSSEAAELTETEWWSDGPLDPERLKPNWRSGFWLLQAVRPRVTISKLLVTAQVMGQAARKYYDKSVPRD